MKVIQLLPELDSGGVERGTLEVGRFLASHGHESLVVSNGGRLVAQLERECSRHIALPVHRKSPASLLQVRSLRKLFREERPDIVHVRSRVPAWLAFLAWRKMDPTRRPRFVTTVHGFYSVNAYSRIMTRGEEIICVSRSVKDYVIENYPGVSEERLHVVHRGVDPEEFPFGYRAPPEWMSRWTEAHPQLVGQFVITLPARLTRWKGQTHFLDLIADLKSRGLPVHGILAGGPHPRKRAFEDELRAKATALGLGQTVSFLGHTTDLREVMASSNLVVSLSTDPEAFGRVSLEALALGIPVAGYAHGGVLEQLEVLLPDGLVPVGDWRAMADLIARWIPDPPAPARENPFTLQAMLAGVLEVYRALLGADR